MAMPPCKSANTIGIRSLVRRDSSRRHCNAIDLQNRSAVALEVLYHLWHQDTLMRKWLEPFWAFALRAVPTYALQSALATRAGVNARFIPSGVSENVAIKGVCWLTINYD